MNSSSTKNTLNEGNIKVSFELYPNEKEVDTDSSFDSLEKIEERLIFLHNRLKEKEKTKQLLINESIMDEKSLIEEEINPFAPRTRLKNSNENLNETISKFDESLSLNQNDMTISLEDDLEEDNSKIDQSHISTSNNHEDLDEDILEKNEISELEKTSDLTKEVFEEIKFSKINETISDNNKISELKETISDNNKISELKETISDKNEKNENEKIPEKNDISKLEEEGICLGEEENNDINAQSEENDIFNDNIPIDSATESTIPSQPSPKKLIDVDLELLQQSMERKEHELEQKIDLELIRCQIKYEEERAKKIEGKIQKMKEKKTSENDEKYLKNVSTFRKCFDYLNIQQNFLLKNYEVEMNYENTNSNDTFDQLFKTKDALTDIVENQNEMKETIVHFKNKIGELQNERSSLDNLIQEFNRTANSVIDECGEQLRNEKEKTETKINEMNKKIKNLRLIDEKLRYDEESSTKELGDREKDFEKIQNILNQLFQQ
ncbi:hypothetical protein SNEBB_003660 [Seison nebaliae]|nr:hypothetical protein SNEBB_003660 [Seison nebaliae]